MRDLIERLENAEAGSRELDHVIDNWVMWGPRSEWENCGGGYERHKKTGDRREFGLWSRTSPSYTTSIDAATALVEKLLPGWLYSICHCHVSDDAWLMPDFNDPAHSERLMREFGQVEGDPSQHWQNLTDVALHPPRGLALALCISVLKALEARK